MLFVINNVDTLRTMTKSSNHTEDGIREGLAFSPELFGRTLIKTEDNIDYEKKFKK